MASRGKTHKTTYRLGKSNLKRRLIGYSTAALFLLGLSGFAFAFNQSTQKASAATVPESCYTFDSGTGTITDYNASNDIACLSDIDIPATIGGVPVTAIGDYAFSAKALTSVTFPDSIITMGSGAFYQNALTSLVLPSNIETIGVGAFQDNSITGTVVLPDSLTSMLQAVFEGNQIQEVVIGSGLTVLRSNVFYNNNISNIVFSDNSSLTQIDPNAFTGNNLTSVTLPDSMLVVNSGSFTNNPIATFVTGNNLTRIWPAFIDPTTLKTVQIGDTDYTGPANLGFSTGEFSGAQLETLILGNSVSELRGASFGGVALKHLVVPTSVTYLGDGAFQGSLLEEVIITGDNTVIAGAPFAGVAEATGEYLRILTANPANPQNYTDSADNSYGYYIINPASVTVKYVDSQGNPVSSELYQTGATLSDYTVAANPTADYSLYYRSGDTLSFTAPDVSGYQTPSAQDITLDPGANTVTFVYYTPEEIAAMNQPEAPNTGLKHSVSPLLYGLAGIVGLGLVAMLVAKRPKTSK